MRARHRKLCGEDNVVLRVGSSLGWIFVILPVVISSPSLTHLQHLVRVLPFPRVLPLCIVVSFGATFYVVART